MVGGRAWVCVHALELVEAANYGSGCGALVRLFGFATSPGSTRWK